MTHNTASKNTVFVPIAVSEATADIVSMEPSLTSIHSLVSAPDAIPLGHVRWD